MMRRPQRAALMPKPMAGLLVLLILACLSSRHARVNGFTNGFPTASRSKLSSKTIILVLSSSSSDDDGSGDAGDGFLSGLFRGSKDSKPEVKSGFRNVPGSKGQMMDRPGVAVKPRPMVRLDADTGTYKPTVATKSPISAAAQQLSAVESPGGSVLKDLFYGSLDAIETVATATGKVGYGDTDEETAVLGGSSSSSGAAEEAPGARLLKQYEAQREKEREAREQIVRAASKKGVDDEDEEIYEEDTKSALDVIGEAFASTKDGIYGAVDFISADKGKGGSEEQPSLSRPIDVVSSSSAPPFRPVAKPSQNEDETVLQVQSLLPDLTSKNPLKRVRAELVLRSAESKRRRRDAEEDRREGVRKAKEAVYAVADGVKTTAEIVVTAPVKAVDGTVKAMSAIPEVVEGTVETIQSIPLEVDKTLKGVQKTADQTTRFAKEVAEDVQNLPSTVQAKVDETKRAVEETKRTTASLTKRVSNAVWDAEVVLGLKPLRPKPPKPPPPPPTLEEQGVRVVSSTAEAATKVALLVGKGAFGLASAGAKAAWGPTRGQLTKVAAEVLPSRLPPPVVSTNTVKTAENVQSPSRTVDIFPTLSDIDTGLDREVSDALKMAEEALSTGEVEKPTEKSG